MLLQSNAGYIEPLAAIPSSWSTGSYTGLCAEGNFEVSAAWENGTAKTFNILSKSGGTASVAYPSITNASVVRASDGQKVDYTAVASDRISFDTEIGETYIISGFSKVEAPDAPETLDYTRVRFEEFNLNWTPTETAVKYNVYVAIENAPDYTLIAKTSDTYASYIPTKENENARMTFAVTAVNADGIESRRTLSYYNPVDTSASVEKLSVNVTLDGELQVIVNANGNTLKYRLYEKAAGASEYTLIDESGFPLLYNERYNDTSEYAVSVISFYDAEESELAVIKNFASAPVEYDAKNILDGKTFVQTSGAEYNPISGYGYHKLTDGIIDTVTASNGRFSSNFTNDSGTRGAAAEVDLGGTYILSELRFFVYERLTKHLGTNFTLEVYSEGKWVKIVDSLENSELAENYVKTVSTGKEGLILCFDLGLIRGSKIRFSADAVSGTTITWYEAECSGIMLLDESSSYFDNVFTGKEFIGSEPTVYHEGSGGDVFTYDKLTDGIISSNEGVGRYSSVRNGKLNGTLALGGIYELNELRLYDFRQNVNKAGQNLKVEIFYNGKWTTALSVPTNAEIASHRVSVSATTGGAWLAFDLGGVLAEKVKITADAVSEEYVTFYEIECSGKLVEDFGEYNENLLLGKSFDAAEGTTVYRESYGYQCLTDGIFAEGNGRFSTAGNSFAEATVDLGGEYYLTEIRFYDFVRDTSYSISSPTHAGDEFTLEVLSGGKWITLVQYETVDDLQAHRIKTGTNGAGQGWLAFDVGMKAEKIRFYAKGSSLTRGYVTYYEIECSGYGASENSLENNSSNALLNKNIVISPAYDDEYNILYGKEFVPTGEALSAVYNTSTLGYDKLTDGDYTSRFSSKQNTMAQATVDLEGVYKLSELRIKYYSNNVHVGAKLAINLYCNGEWRTVVNCQDNASIMTYASNGWLIFDLSGELAEKIEFVIPETTSGGYVSLYEIECTGSKSTISSLTVKEPQTNVNDGDLNTYTEVSGSASYAVIFDLEVPKLLYSLKIYELLDSANLIDGKLSTASDDTAVEVYRNGVWVRIAEGISLDIDADYTEINLYGTECSKVKVIFNNTRLFDGETEYRAARISEITCTEGMIPMSLKNLSDALDRLPLAEGNGNSGYPYNATYDKFKEKLLNIGVSTTNEEVELFILEIEDYLEKLELISNISFTPMASITLDSNLIFNIYIPEDDRITEVKLNGDTITLGEAKNGYYIVSTPLAAAEAAKTLTLTVNLTVEGTPLTGTFSFSTVKYASKLLSMNTSAEEQTLAKDMLAYVRSAYVYFNNATADTAEVKAIDAVLDGYASTATIDTGDAKCDVDGLSGATFVLGANPAIRFYLDTYTADKFSFKVGNRALLASEANTGSDADGDYIEFTLYAYEMTEVFSYEIADTEIKGEYNLIAYYADAVEKSDNELTDIVAKFYNYCYSAKEYREYVISINNQ